MSELYFVMWVGMHILSVGSSRDANERKVVALPSQTILLCSDGCELAYHHQHSDRLLSLRQNYAEGFLEWTEYWRISHSLRSML